MDDPPCKSAINPVKKLNKNKPENQYDFAAAAGLSAVFSAPAVLGLHLENLDPEQNLFQHQQHHPTIGHK